MKKWLLVLGMIACIFGTTACGEQVQEVEAQTTVTEDSAKEIVTGLLTQINMIVSQNMQEQYKDDAFASAAMESWSGALEDIGDFQSVTACTVKGTDKDLTFNATISGSKREADVVIVVEDGAYKSLTVNPRFELSELMVKAGLNTLIGMGSVFAVLILISLIISLFAYIPKLEKMFSKKNEVKTESIDNAVAQIIENEELSDDSELVAVIAAAIASYEGTGTDGFVVRSIRHANASKWRNA
ncbi:MAG: OadG family protein [Lachnospiraceae bacterium]|nr:OadG family protein [Lachnospiraceae bacterium]